MRRARRPRMFLTGRRRPAYPGRHDRHAHRPADRRPLDRRRTRRRRRALRRRPRPRDRPGRRAAWRSPPPPTSTARSAPRARRSPAWSSASLAKRTTVLFAYRELLAARLDDVARLITAEHGKTLDDARGEVQRGLEVVEFACGIAHLMKGEGSEQISTRVDSTSYRQPLGVVAGITPFNFPAMVPMWMYPLALACGNSFILKPSEKDPSAALLMAELLAEAGLPAGRLQRRPGRQGRRRRAAHPPRDRRRVVRRLDARREVHLRDGDRARQARAGARRREEPRARPARREPRRRRRRDRLRRVRQRRAALHGDQRRRHRRRGHRRASSTAKVVERARALTVGPGADAAERDGPARHRRGARPRRRLRRRAGRRRARPSRSTAAASSSAATRRASSSGRASSTTSPRR